jgi:single-stranded DNA-binding protein
MINSATMEGELSVKPVLLESRTGAVTEFNLEHSDLTGPQPVRYAWRCKATGALAQTIAERGSKGQRLVVQGKFVQELATGSGGQSLAVVKLLVLDVSFGQSSWGAN